MIYRFANPLDADQIALLHADSWRRTYRGMFNDDFLDKEADQNRKEVWRIRLSSAREDQFTYVAEADKSIAGFVCAYGHEDKRWGSLIDNLHVLPLYQRQGVGRHLMSQAFEWLKTNYPDDDIYLWVLENNLRARTFYEKLGATNAGEVDKLNPVGGGSAVNCRYIWPLTTSE